VRLRVLEVLWSVDDVEDIEVAIGSIHAFSFAGSSKNEAREVDFL